MKRNLVILPVPASTLVRIAWEGGGEVPEDLSGSFTNPKAAKQAIDQWMGKSGREEELVVLMKTDEEKRKAPAKMDAINK